MKTMNFNFDTKEGRLNAAKEFANEFMQHLTEGEAVNISYSDDEHLLSRSIASPRDLEYFITGMLHDMPKLIALVLLRRVMQHLVENDLED